MDLLQGSPPYTDGRHLFSAHVKNGEVSVYSRDGIAPHGGTARIITVEEAAAETRAAIAHAYQLAETLPTEFYGPISNAITEIISCYQNEAISRLLATAFNFTDAPSYDSVLILPDEWIQDVGGEEARCAFVTFSPRSPTPPRCGC